MKINGEAWVYPSDVITAQVTYGRLWWRRTVEWNLQVLEIEDGRIRLAMTDVELSKAA